MLMLSLSSRTPRSSLGYLGVALAMSCALAGCSDSESSPANPTTFPDASLDALDAVADNAVVDVVSEGGADTTVDSASDGAAEAAADAKAGCKDGVVQLGEQCDTTVGTATCNSVDAKYHAGVGTLTCNDSCEYDVSGCQYCGDKIKNGKEECDGTVDKPNCMLFGYIGGGTVTCTSGCKYDKSQCVSGAPQIKGMSYEGGGNLPGSNWPNGKWTTKAIFVNEKGEPVGSLSDGYTRDYSGGLYPKLGVAVVVGVPSTFYKVRVYRSTNSAFTLSTSGISYAEYGCGVVGGPIAAYCAVPGATLPNLKDGDFKTLVEATQELCPGGTDVADAMSDNAFDPMYKTKKHQYLYLKTDLVAAGLAAGSTITKLGVKVSKDSVSGLPSFRIGMLQTPMVSFNKFISTPPLPEVVYGPTNVLASAIVKGTWAEFPLTTPVVWNGTSNLVVEFSLFDASGTAKSGGGIYQRATDASGGIRHEGGYGHTGTLPYPYEGLNNNIHAREVAVIRLTYLK